MEIGETTKNEEEKTVVQQENDITTSKVERMCRGKRFESKREVATSTGKYEAFASPRTSSKTPTDRSFHYYPRIRRDKDWDKSISLYKNRKGGGREEWMGRSCGADAIYDTANRSPLP